jgi:hypothetical protein
MEFLHRYERVDQDTNGKYVVQSTTAKSDEELEGILLQHVRHYGRVKLGETVTITHAIAPACAG